MICPYVVNRKIVRHTEMIFNDELEEIGHDYIENNIAQCMACQKENCGAWLDGKCHYRG